MSDLKHRLESILFSAGRRLTLEELSSLTKERDIDRIKTALQELKQDLHEKGSSIMLIDEGDSWKMTVHEKYLPFVRKIVTKTELPKSIIETLAVVAFKAPCMQSKVIQIRTNKAYRHLDQLEEMGYITREKKGRTKLIKLTQKFFEYFDVPPDKLKEKFAGFKELEKVIEQKEAVHTEVVEEEKQEEPEIDLVDDAGHKEKLEVYDSEKIDVYETKEIPEPLEPAVDEIDGLEIYESEIKEKKKKHKKKKKKKKKKEAEEGEEEGEEYEEEVTEEEETPEEEAAEEVEEEPEEETEEVEEEVEEEKPKKRKGKKKKEKEVEEEPEEETTEEPAETPAPEEERITLGKIKEEAAKVQAKPRKYETEGIFKGEIPTELEQKIAKKAEEIVYGKKEEIEEEETPGLEFEEKPAIEEEEKEEIPEEEKPEVEEEEKEELPEPEEESEEK